jgi:hypothetical protein
MNMLYFMLMMFGFVVCYLLLLGGVLYLEKKVNER